jgi:NAD(P)-dependent dehydrogenase (short-subunit alcohol dehydrogenase family)
MSKIQNNITMIKPLTGQVAIVTGAGKQKGMGWAIALKLAQHGAKVVVTDICLRREDLEIPGILTTGDDFDVLKQLAEVIEDNNGEAIPMAVDITAQNQIEECVKSTFETFGRIDILVNNAGVATGVGPFLEMTDQQWDTSYKVNLKGTADFCKAVIPEMKKHSAGTIINNASTAGLGGIPGMAAYCATKFGIIGLTKVIAAEFGKDRIRCNAVCPGLILTEMGLAEIKIHADNTGLDLETAKKELADSTAMQRWATPEEVADAVAYLAGPSASYITGVALPVAGGIQLGL